MSQPRVLVAGIGNIFLGDDAFGVEVARRLAALGLPDGARVVDFGIRGLDLTYALLDGYDAVILVDAAPRGEPPGTLYCSGSAHGRSARGERRRPCGGARPRPGQGAAPGLDPGRAGRAAILVGCEPSPIDESEDFGAEMGAAVRAAVDEAVPLITSLVARLLRGEEIVAGGDNTPFGEEADPCCD